MKTAKFLLPALAVISMFSHSSCRLLFPGNNMLPTYRQKPNKTDREVTLRNYGTIPMTLCVAANPAARCKCQTVNAGKQVRLKLNNNENERIIKIFNNPADTAYVRYNAHGGNTYGFKYDNTSSRWKYIDK